MNIEKKFLSCKAANVCTTSHYYEDLDSEAR